MNDHLIRAERETWERGMLVEHATGLARIHRIMDGQSWSPDTLDEIAAVLADCGFEIRDVQE